MLGRLRDVAVIALLAVGLNVAMTGSWLRGVLVAAAELLFLGFALIASLYVRP